jgi:hypothetical protein
MFSTKALREENERLDALLGKVRWVLPAGSMRRVEPEDYEAIEGTFSRVVDRPKLNVINP